MKNAQAVDSPAGSPYQFKADDYSSHSAILRFAFPLPAGARVLDLACDKGYLGERLKERFEVYGVERNPETAARARPHYREVAVLDLAREPVPECFGTFDLIILGGILEHLPDPEAVLRSALTRLQPGGRVIITTSNIAHGSIRLNLLFGRFEPADRGIMDRTHLHFWTFRGFRSLLEGCGLSVDRLYGTAIPLPLVIPATAKGRPLHFVYRFYSLMVRVWPTLFGFEIIAECRRAGE
ncbi:MAG: class I SAM-dependent methyltransferase [Verrucomicrobia bacterium]|nr:class I SAM-dependent methyltransferase [Verrucomicrobiota bacterium]